MSDLSTFHLQAMERISASFFDRGDSEAALAERSSAVDQIVAGLFDRAFPEAGRTGAAVLAVGGYGRKQLFPHSDVDLLFLFGKESDAESCSEDLSGLLTSLWDAQLRISQSVRTPAECSRLIADNSELHISLLDARLVAGDRELFEDLTRKQLPRFYLRERKSLLRSLARMLDERHRAYERTIYHLEPNVKESPGGLRDFQTACWISQLAHLDPARTPSAEEYLPAESRDAVGQAKRFLFSTRLYLHYFAGRDNNRLTFDLQDAIASDGAGKAFREVRDAAEWMRDYFLSARTMNRLALRSVDEYATPKNSLYTLLRDRTSKLSNEDFVVTHGRVFLRRKAALKVEPRITMSLFLFVARHGLPLAVKTEQAVEAAIPALAEYVREAPKLWPQVAEILRQPYAYRALTAMHELGALFVLFPELEEIDCLVLRDFYHRYTVDEHTFLTIKTLKRLHESDDPYTRRFAELRDEVGRSELLYFALLFHDAGKGGNGKGHVERSVDIAEQASRRLGLGEAEWRTVKFLIEHHLTMSSFMVKRDISDPETAEEMVEIVGAIENLRALTLLTYADTSAVHPNALTPWRKQLLWQLYLAAHNRLTGQADDRRLGSERVAPVLAAAEGEDDKEALRDFLEGFPERYLRTHTTEEILEHYAWSRELAERNAAVHIRRVGSQYEVHVLTGDKPFLFAALCATMAGFGLNIERAEAFSNARGVVLDSFHTTVSSSRGGEIEDAELRQLEKTLKRVVAGREDPHALLGRRKRLFGARGRTPIEPAVTFDNQSSSRATIFHVAAEDRTGLLYDLTSAFSKNGCDIEVVLIETQGRKAIDVFYVVLDGRKLTDDEAQSLIKELRAACRSSRAA